MKAKALEDKDSKLEVSRESDLKEVASMSD